MGTRVYAAVMEPEPGSGDGVALCVMSAHYDGEPSGLQQSQLDWYLESFIGIDEAMPLLNGIGHPRPTHPRSLGDRDCFFQLPGLDGYMVAVRTTSKASYDSRVLEALMKNAKSTGMRLFSGDEAVPELERLAERLREQGMW